MYLYRITKEEYAQDLSGMGAYLFGGRWNPKGTYILYTSENIALCTLEALVHLTKEQLEKKFVVVRISVPEKVFKTAETLSDALPDGWDNPGRFHPHTIATGARFVKEAGSLLLKVPSAVVDGQYNYLINPRHPDLLKIKISKIKPYKFDSRLMEMVTAMSADKA